jgi:hypothetical protein
MLGCHNQIVARHGRCRSGLVALVVADNGGGKGHHQRVRLRPADSGKEMTA